MLADELDYVVGVGPRSRRGGLATLARLCAAVIPGPGLRYDTPTAGTSVRTVQGTRMSLTWASYRPVV